MHINFNSDVSLGNNEGIELTVPDFIISLYLSVFQSCKLSVSTVKVLNSEGNNNVFLQECTKSLHTDRG